MLGSVPPAKASTAVATVTSIHNIVRHRLSAGPSWNPASVGAPVGQGDAVQTGARSRAELTYYDGSLVRMAGSATLTFVDPDRRVVKLLLGKLWAKIKPGSGGLKVQTTAAVVAVIGTEFILEVLPDETVNLIVLSGKVRVFPPTVSPVEVDRSLVSGGGTPGPSGEQTGQPPQEPGPQTAPGTLPATAQSELDETVSFRQGGTGGSKVPAQPLEVSQGQGATVRPGVSFSRPYEVNVGQVVYQEAPLIAGEQSQQSQPAPLSVIGPASTYTPEITPTQAPVVTSTPVQPSTPQVPPATVTKTQLENQRIDPQDLKGSPTTGDLRVIIDIIQP